MLFTVFNTVILLIVKILSKRNIFGFLITKISEPNERILNSVKNLKYISLFFFNAIKEYIKIKLRVS